MDGENLRDEFMEVALEQWTEKAGEYFSRLQRIPGVRGEQYRKGLRFPYWQRAGRFSLNLGGNTDEIFALSYEGLGRFFARR